MKQNLARLWHHQRLTAQLLLNLHGAARRENAHGSSVRESNRGVTRLVSDGHGRRNNHRGVNRYGTRWVEFDMHAPKAERDGERFTRGQNTKFCRTANLELATAHQFHARFARVHDHGAATAKCDCT